MNSRALRTGRWTVAIGGALLAVGLLAGPELDLVEWLLVPIGSATLLTGVVLLLAGLVDRVKDPVAHGLAGVAGGLALILLLVFLAGALAWWSLVGLP